MARNQFAYASGTTTATVDVPAGAFLQRVSVLPGAGAATLTIGGGDTITVPAGSAFSEEIGGVAIDTDVVIGGDVGTYYVAWKAA